MKKLRVYIDTSVIGGCFDEQFKHDSLLLFDEIKSNQKIAVISEVFIRELQDAPVFVKEFYDEIREICEVISLDDEIDLLSEQYLEAKIVSRKFKNDTLHIAAATVNYVDILVSWNFKHIVNFNRIIQFNSVNVKNGYRELTILSPKEVINYGS